jgi:hypothetical protein
MCGSASERSCTRRPLCLSGRRGWGCDTSVPTADGFLSTGDIEHARELVAAIDFFETAFGAAGEDQEELHAQAIATLLDEVHGWHEESIRTHDGSTGGGERHRR